MSVELSTIAKKKFSAEEAALLEELTKPGAKIEVTVPAEINPKDWSKTTNVVCRALLRAQVQEQKLLPVLGRLLLIAESNTEIWAGHDSFKSFLQTDIQGNFGVSTSSSYEALQVAKRLPHLKLGEVAVIPRRNMRIAMQAIARGEETKAYAKVVLAKAAELTEKQLRDYCEEKHYIGPGETVGAYLRIGCSQEEQTIINVFLANTDYQSYCGTANQASMLIRAIEEASTEWTAQNQEASPE